jgi:hypothetical protein
MITFDAHFDGQRLCPEQPVSLPINVPLRVTVIESSDTHGPAMENPSSNALGPFEKIEAELGLIDGPADWSAEVDHYLYGTPKRGNDPS